MRAGISTACLYPWPTEDALRSLAENGVACAEVFLNSFSELEPAYIRELRAAAGRTQILAVHPFTSGLEPMLFFSQYSRRFQDGRELYKRYYEAAAALGAGIVVFHGNIPGMHLETAQYVERLGVLMEDARRQGVELCHENVSRCVGRDPQFFRQLSENLPDARFVFDLKQAVRSGVDVLAFAGVMGNHIAHVHISDHNDRYDCLPPGDGVFNMLEFVKQMRFQEFSGGLIVELYRENFCTLVDLLACYQHVCDVVSTVS